MFQENKELTVTLAPRVGQWHVLAEAIRSGCRKFPKQYFGALMDTWPNATATCAMGAAIEGGGWDRNNIGPAPKKCPACGVERSCERGGYSGSPSFSAIAHLNDDHRWTREAIADWLDTL